MTASTTDRLNTNVARLVAAPTISANAIANFLAVQNVVTQGVDVTFTLAVATGVASITLLRNSVMDPASATVLQSWSAVALAGYTWSDTDSALQADGQVFYWLHLNPTGIGGTTVQVGPQNVVLNPQLVAPVSPTGISAGHGPLINGTVLVTCNVAGVTSGLTIRVSGYQGNASFVAVASAASAPIQFALNATGETITIQALGVSAGGVATATGPTTTLTLNSAQTVPAKPQALEIAQLSTGNQVMFPVSKDATLPYKIFRAQRGQTFLLATLLATVTGTAGTIEFLDTGGLSGDWEYFVVAANAAGSSPPSDPASPAVLFTSAGIPTNVPANTTNTATIDSVDAGSSALVRIFGPGGVGTSYMRVTGFGSLTRPNGTISGLAYSTTYGILWNGTNHIAVTTYPATLPDGQELVGTIITTGPTGVIGSGATATAVVNGTGQVIQVNPVAVGSLYGSATVNLSGGGGSGAQATANIVGGKVTSYTVINGGSGYATAPAVTVVGGATGGTVGGGGSTGSATGSRGGGCVEVGTDVIVPEGTEQTIEPCNEWVYVDMMDGRLYMHPDTLVSVFKKASELTLDDRVEVIGAKWRKPELIGHSNHQGFKVKRTCPGGTYHAGPSLVRLHNVKPPSL